MPVANYGTSGDNSYVVMKYGDYEFHPAPMITCEESRDITGTVPTGKTITVTFTGELIAPLHGEGFNNEVYGVDNDPITEVYGFRGLGVINRLKRRLEDALQQPGKLFSLECRRAPDYDGPDNVGPFQMFAFYPRLTGSIQFSPSEDNWTQTTPYTFQMQYDRSDVTEDEELLYLQSISENWSIAFADDKEYGEIGDAPHRLIQVTHTLNATGKKVYGIEVDKNVRGDDITFDEYTPDGVLKPHEYAQKWVLSKLRTTINQNDIAEDMDEYDPKPVFFLDGDGVFNFSIGRNMLCFAHNRQREVDEIAGSYGVTETWLLKVGGDPDMEPFAVTDDYSLDFRFDRQTGDYTVALQGTIQGYNTDLVNQITENPKHSKDSNAEAYFNEYFIGQLIRDRRVRDYWESMEDAVAADALALGIQNKALQYAIPQSYTIGRNPAAGTITYNYEFSTKCLPIIPGALSESISIAMTYPNHVYGKVTVPGRKNGPVFFKANTITAPQMAIAIDIVVDRGQCPPTNVPGTGIIGANTTTSRAGLPYSDFNSFTPPITVVDAVQAFLNRCVQYLRSAAGKDSSAGLHADFVVVVSETSNWNFSEGRYTHNITFEFGSCGNKFLNVFDVGADRVGTIHNQPIIGT
jgi:hypothetical protein